MQLQAAYIQTYSIRRSLFDDQMLKPGLKIRGFVHFTAKQGIKNTNKRKVT